MKLTPENITAIEAALSDYEQGYLARAIIARHGFHDLATWGGFIRGMRNLGVEIHKSRMAVLSDADRADFLAWLREKHAAEQRASAPSDLREAS